MKGVKTGGRKKGTPNKDTALRQAVGKEAISDLLSEYMQTERMKMDFAALDPKDRIYLAEKLFSYIMPKMQATAVDLSTSQKDKSLEHRLEDMSNEITKSK